MRNRLQDELKKIGVLVTAELEESVPEIDIDSVYWKRGPHGRDRGTVKENLFRLPVQVRLVSRDGKTPEKHNSGNLVPFKRRDKK